jgi:hypothetical protein
MNHILRKISSTTDHAINQSPSYARVIFILKLPIKVIENEVKYIKNAMIQTLNHLLVIRKQRFLNRERQNTSMSTNEEVRKALNIKGLALATRPDNTISKAAWYLNTIAACYSLSPAATSILPIVDIFITSEPAFAENAVVFDCFFEESEQYLLLNDQVQSILLHDLLVIFHTCFREYKETSDRDLAALIDSMRNKKAPGRKKLSDENKRSADKTFIYNVLARINKNRKVIYQEVSNIVTDRLVKEFACKINYHEFGEVLIQRHLTKDNCDMVVELSNRWKNASHTKEDWSLIVGKS